MFTAKLIFIVVVGGGLLFLLNYPIFQMVDSLFYGSTEAANRARQEQEAYDRSVREAENRNLFNQVDSLLTTGHTYRSDHRSSWTVGDCVKAGIIVIELMVVGAWFLH